MADKYSTELSKELTPPAGFRVRAANQNDLEMVANMINACWIEYTGRNRIDTSELSTEWSRPYIDLNRDTLLVTDSGGNLAGHATIFDGTPHVRAPVWADVHPGYLGQGIGTLLVKWAKSRGEQMIPKAPVGSRVVLVQDRLNSLHNARELLCGKGYKLARHDLEMVIKMDAPPPKPKLPEGITIRACSLPEEESATVEAIRVAFKGHWGYVERPFDDDLKEWQNFFYKAPNCDPELLLVAVDGDEIIGTCFNVPTPAEGPESAWIFALGVHPDRRKTGLGLALLQHSFGALYSKMLKQINLTVDAQNLTGATRLYDKAGMRTRYQSDIFEYELRPGKDLSA